MKIREFELVNDEKVYRAINGSPIRGLMVGGVKEFVFEPPVLPEVDGKKKELSKKELEEEKEKQLVSWEYKVLVEYDRLGGLILKNGLKVKTGSIYSFRDKKARPEPKIMIVTKVDDEIVELDEESAKEIDRAKQKVAKIKAKKIRRK